MIDKDFDSLIEGITLKTYCPYEFGQLNKDNHFEDKELIVNGYYIYFSGRSRVNSVFCAGGQCASDSADNDLLLEINDIYILNEFCTEIELEDEQKAKLIQVITNNITI